jgi:hypothetical protein
MGVSPLRSTTARDVPSSHVLDIAGFGGSARRVVSAPSRSLCRRRTQRNSRNLAFTSLVSARRRGATIAYISNMRAPREDDVTRDSAEFRLDGDSVEFLDFSPEFVEAFDTKEIAFFEEGEGDDHE